MNLCGRPTAYCLAVIGGIFCVSMVAIRILFDDLFLYMLNQQMVLSPDSEGFEMMKNIDQHFDLSAKFYFFQIENPEEIIEGKLPKLTQKGPYTYRMRPALSDVKFSADGNLMFFKERRTFFFQREHSVGSENDTIQIINIPLVATAIMSRKAGWIARNAVEMSIGALADNLFLNRTISQLMFEGYEDGIVGLNSLVGRQSKFGFFVDRNGTANKELAINTAKDSFLNVNKVYSCENKTKMDIWYGDSCNEIKGTIGFLRPSMSTEKSELVFMADLCRPFRVFYDGEARYHDMKVHRFHMNNMTLAEGIVNPENACFNKEFDLPSGTQELGPCALGAPILLSQPHFYGADESYIKYAKDMNPQKELHNFYSLSEPLSGLTVKLVARLQTNLYVEAVSMFNMDEFATGALPIFWTEMTMDVKPHITKMIRQAVEIKGPAKMMFLVLAALGLLICFFGLGLLYRTRRKSMYSQVSTKLEMVDGAATNHI